MTATGDDSPTISGHLGTISAQDVMGFVADLPQGGALEIESTDGELVLYFEDGAIVGGKVARGGIDPTAWHVRRGRLSSEDLVAVRDRLDTVDLHSALLAAGRLDAERVDQLVAEELLENLVRLFSWTPGDFRFYEGRKQSMDIRSVVIEIPALLFESTRVHKDWSSLPEIYAEGNTQFELRAEPRLDGKLALDLNEWKLLFLVTNRRRLAEIWRESPLGSEFDTSRTLFGLASARLVQPIGSAKASSAPSHGQGESAGTNPPPPPTLHLSGAAAALSTTITGSRERDPEADTQPVAVQDDEPSSTPPAVWASAPNACRGRRLTRAQIQVERTPCLVQMVDDSEQGFFPLAGQTVSLGRSVENNLVLPDGHVSARHARILREGDHFEIEDTQSSNGIRVNGHKLLRSALTGGEEIEVFPYHFRFEMAFEIRES